MSISKIGLGQNFVNFRFRASKRNSLNLRSVNTIAKPLTSTSVLKLNPIDFLQNTRTTHCPPTCQLQPNASPSDIQDEIPLDDACFHIHYIIPPRPLILCLLLLHKTITVVSKCHQPLREFSGTF